ncbi:MAG TPA: hypothetical protein VGX76_14675 [Pirellulales bacterium]|jgi:hypothetical protein|nr:hypothetical protein [Pirellulales bacterium]
MAKKKPKNKPAVMAKSKKPPAPAKNKAAAKKPIAASVAGTKPGAAKLTWLDDVSHQPTIERYARRLAPFVEALADGKIDEAELKAQEGRLVKLMKEVEPALPAALHAKVTQLLYELTAYDVMQILHAMEQSRPRAVFQG